MWISLLKLFLHLFFFLSFLCRFFDLGYLSCYNGFVCFLTDSTDHVLEVLTRFLVLTSSVVFVALDIVGSYVVLHLFGKLTVV